MPQDEQDRSVLAPELRDALERAAEELFVGRARELGQLDSALKDALGGRGRLCLVAGEPGIGKTRLVERIASGAAEQGANVFWGRCWEGEGAPAFWPWVQVIRSHMRACDAPTLASQLGIGAPYVAQVVPEVREVLPDVPAAPTLDSEQARFRLYDSVCAFLRNAAARTPLVLVLDDLHWADKSSLLLLRFLAREIADTRLYVLGTYRDVEVSRGSPLAEALPALRRERTVERLLLRGLPEDEVRAMLAALGNTEVPEEFAAEIARETGGNPFFIKEIGRHLLDEGIAYREGNQWVGPVTAEEIRLPESVREVIGQRLSRLGDRTAKLLTVASVVGQEFGLDLLERAAELSREALIEALEDAASARVVEKVPQAIGRYRFSHTLIRETLYQELRTLERVRLHGRIGGALEKLFAEDPEAHLAELAHHFLESLPGGDAAKAVDYAVRAGDRAATQLAHEQAAILYGRALQALDVAPGSDDRRRCELLLKLGEAQWGAGGFENPGEVFREAAGLAEKLGEPELLARAALGFSGPSAGFAFSQSVIGEIEIDLLRKALVALGEEDTALRARMMGRMSTMLTLVGGADSAERAPADRPKAMARQAVEMARRIGDRGALAYVLNATMAPGATLDDLKERLAVIDEIIRLADEVGDPRLAAEGYQWRAAHYLEIGEIEAADRDFAAQSRFAEKSRQPYQRWLAALNRAMRASLEGRFEDAESAIREVNAFGKEAWGATRSDLSRIFEGLLREQQRLPHADDIADLEAIVARVGGVTYRTYRIGLVRRYVQVGRVEEARRELARIAANDFSDVPYEWVWLYTMSRLAEIAFLLDDEPRRKALYDYLLPYAGRCVIAGALFCVGSVSRSLGILATLLSRFDEAEKHFEDALEMNARIRSPVWVAHTQHDYARMLVARDAPADREKAARFLETALATTRATGMKVLEQAILVTLGETGLTVSEKLPPVPAPVGECRFQREGDFWAITYEGQSLRLRDAKGLQYVAALIRNEGDEIHATDLATGPADAATGAVRDAGHSGEILDAQARAEYRERLRDLEIELEEATRWSDVGRAARLQEEIEFLKDELSAAFGVGGRARKAGDVTERARKAVASRIRDAIERIGKEHRALALHLENAIRTGAFCCYRPDRSPGWRL